MFNLVVHKVTNGL